MARWLLGRHVLCPTKPATAAASAATCEISIPPITFFGAAVDYVEMSNAVADVAAVPAFLAAETTDVLCAAKAADSRSCAAITQDGIGLTGPHTAPTEVSISSPCSRSS